MLDIYIGIAVIAAVSAGLVLLALKIGARVSTTAQDFIALGTVGAIVVYINVLQESAALAAVLPFSNLIVIGNWFPPLGAFLAGLAWKRIPGSRPRRTFFVCLLAGVSLYSAYARFMGELPASSDSWRYGICLQTSEYSCSAACAATLLKAHGIDATEAEMESLCFTRSGKGTTWYGLFRGLKLKTAGTAWDVQIFKCTLDELRAKSGGPAILSVRLDPHPGIDPRYERKWGWTPGMQHAVVLFEFKSGSKAAMGDPSVGRENWSIGALEELWHGEGMRLVRR